MENREVHRTAKAMAAGLRSLLAETLGLVEQVTCTPYWDRPLRGCQAAHEMDLEEGDPGRPAGSWPWLTALTFGRSALDLAAEEASGFSAVLDVGATSASAEVLCRGILESTSLSWWLLDPAITHRQRLARAFAYRLDGATMTARAVKHFGLEAGEDPSEYGELPAQVVEEIGTLGLPWSGGSRSPCCCDGECMPGHSELVAALVAEVWHDKPEAKLPYAFLSEMAHAGLQGLARGSRLFGNDATTPDANHQFWVWLDAYLVIGALTFSAHRAASFLGLADQTAALAEWTGSSQGKLLTLRPETSENDGA